MRVQFQYSVTPGYISLAPGLQSAVLQYSCYHQIHHQTPTQMNLSFTPCRTTTAKHSLPADPAAQPLCLAQSHTASPVTNAPDQPDAHQATQIHSQAFSCVKPSVYGDWACDSAQITASARCSTAKHFTCVYMGRTKVEARRRLYVAGW